MRAVLFFGMRRETDCHSQFANWLRNDMEFSHGVRWVAGGGVRAPRPTEVYLRVRRGGALPLPRAGENPAPTDDMMVRGSGASGTPPPTGALIDGAEDAILGDYLQPVYRINAAVPCKKRGNAVRYMYWKIPYF